MSATHDAAVLQRLFAVIEGRKQAAAPAGSYTAELLRAGTEKIAQKVGEEAVETVIAAVAGKPDQLVSESADLLYHLLVLWSAAGVRPDRVWRELAAREGTSGLAEKASRGTAHTD